MIELSRMDTEKRNERTMNIDTLPTREIVELINAEDHRCCPR